MGGAIGKVATGVGKIFGLEMEQTLPENPYNDKLLTNKNAPTSHIGVVYGYRRKAGVRIATIIKDGIDPVSGKAEKRYAYIVYALSHGKVKHIASPLMDGKSFKCTYETHLGGIGESIRDLPLIQELGSYWGDSTAKLEGVAAAVIRIERDEIEKLGDVTFDVTGREVWDPVSQTTKFSDNPALCILDYQSNPIYGQGITYPQGFNVSSYIDAANYFDESADMSTVGSALGSIITTDESVAEGFIYASASLNDHLIAGLPVTLYKAGVPILSGRVIYKSVNLQADQTYEDEYGTSPNIKEEQEKSILSDYRYKVYIDGVEDMIPSFPSSVSVDATPSANRYTCNGNVDTSQIIYDNLIALASSFNGYITFLNGVSTILPDRPDVVSGSFDSSNITGDINFTIPNKSEQLNEMTGTWFNPNKGYDQDTATVSSAALLSRDFGIVQPRDINMPFCNNVDLLERVLNIEINKSRHSGPVEFPVLWTALKNTVGDVVTVDDEDLGWPNREFRIVRIGIPDAYNDVMLTVVPYDADDYIEDTINLRQLSDYTLFPDLTELPVPTNFTATRVSNTVSYSVDFSWVPSAEFSPEKFDIEVLTVIRDGGNNITGYTPITKFLGIYANSYRSNYSFSDGTEYQFRLYVYSSNGIKSSRYRGTLYTHAKIKEPSGITVTSTGPWSIVASPTYSVGYETQVNLDHKWYIAEFTSGEPSFENDAQLVQTSKALVLDDLKKDQAYRVWCQAITDFDESYVAPGTLVSQNPDVWDIINGATVSTQDVSEDYVGPVGKIFILSANPQTFLEDAIGVVTPNAVTLTVDQQNFSDAISWSSVPADIVTGSGLTKSLTKEDFADNDAVEVSITSGNLSDTLTIIRIKDGVTPLVGLLTNESHVIDADANGTIIGDLGQAGGTLKVYLGTTDVTTSATFSQSSPVGLTSSINAPTGVYTISAMSANSGTVTFSATYGGVTINKVYSISKALTGASGADSTTPGPSGSRGSKSFYRDISGATSPNDAQWSNGEADAAITSTGLTKVINDTVSLYNESVGFSHTKYWNGTVWTDVGQVIDGNLIVHGSVGADQVDTTSLYAVDATVTGSFTLDGSAYFMRLNGGDSSESPLTLSDLTSGLTLFGADSNGILTYGGKLQTNTIDTLSVFTQEVRDQLVPLITGSTGGTEVLPNLPVSLTTSGLNTKTIAIDPCNTSVATINIEVNDSKNYFGASNQNYTNATYTIAVKRQVNGGAASTLLNITRTGSSSNVYDSDAGEYRCSHSVQVSEVINDSAHGASVNDSLEYTVEITRTSGSVNSPKIVDFSASQQTQGGGAAGVASVLTAPYLGLTSAGSASYPAMELKNDPTSSGTWLRTPSTGLLPYTSGGASSDLGTSSWSFGNIYGTTLYEGGVALASKYAALSHNHNSVYLGISAKAASATTADNVGGVIPNRMIYGVGNAGVGYAGTTYNQSNTEFSKAGFWDVSGSIDMPDTGWWWGLTLAHRSSSSSYSYGANLAVSNSGSALKVRSFFGGPVGSTNPWRTTGMLELSQTWTGINTFTQPIRSNDEIEGFYTSDKKLKFDFKPFKNALDTISKWFTGAYTKKLRDGSTRFEEGLFAQDAQKGLETVVKKNADGFLTIKQGGNELAAYTLAAVNELHDKHNKEVAELTTRLEKLEKLIND